MRIVFYYWMNGKMHQLQTCESDAESAMYAPVLEKGGMVTLRGKGGEAPIVWRVQDRLLYPAKETLYVELEAELTIAASHARLEELAKI